MNFCVRIAGEEVRKTNRHKIKHDREVQNFGEGATVRERFENKQFLEEGKQFRRHFSNFMQNAMYLGVYR